MKIRELTPSDLPAVADIHMAAFPASAISRLGREAARRFYDSLMRGPHDASGWGAVECDHMVGYCFGGVWRNAEVFYLRQNVLYLAWRALTHPWLLNHPFFRSRVRLAFRLLQPGKRAPNALAPPVDAGERRFGIQSIAVHPTFQGRGVAKLLLQSSEAMARRRGFSKMDLSVHTDNQRAIGFYERMGWERFLTDGVWRGFMFRRLD